MADDTSRVRGKSMTSHANAVTDRATNIQTAISTVWIGPMLDSFERLWHNRAVLLEAGNLKPADLEDRDARISAEACGAIFARAQELQPTKNLALRLAAQTPLGAYPLIDYLVLTSDSVGAGMKQLSRYFHLIGAPVVMEVRDGEDPVRVAVESSAFGVEYSTSLAVLHFRQEAIDGFNVLHVSFRHQPDHIAEFEHVLGCPMLAGECWSGLVISRAAWECSLRRRDPILRQMLERYADEIAAQLPPNGLASEVGRVLASRVAGGDTSLRAVAREMGTSVRTLQRRLTDEGLSYQDLLDRARHQGALRYLADRSLSIAEIAWLLGYSESSAFHRAFRRWEGGTPQSWRATRRANLSI